MKSPILRRRALERLYQKALRLLREDEGRFEVDPDIDFEKRAKEFVASMSGYTQTLLVYHVKEQHGHDAFEEFMWLFSPLAASIFSLEEALLQADAFA